MATVTIKIDDTDALAVPYREDDKGDPETLTEYCQRQIDAQVATAVSQKRQRDFDSFDDATKDTMIAAEKAKE